MKRHSLKKLAIIAHLSLLVVALILLYWQFFKYLIHTWLNNMDYMPGMIIPLLAFYMVWKKRAILISKPINPSKTGLFFITVSILLYVGGQTAYIKIAHQFSFFIIIPGIILYYFGIPILRALALPLLILLFMAPYAELLHSFLQVSVARTCAEILRLFDVPVYIEGHSIYLPNTEIFIDPGCLGLRNITAILPISITLADVYFHHWWKKMSIVMFSLILASFSNIFRIVTMLICALKGNEIFLTGAPHKIYGYSVFLGALAILFSFSALLKRCSTKSFSEQKEIITNKNLLPQSWSRSFSSYGNLILIGLILLPPGLIHMRLMAQPSEPLKRSLKSFPIVLGKWQGSELTEHEWHPKIIALTENLRLIYKDASEDEIKIFVSYLPIQTQNQELIFTGNRIIPPRFRTSSRKLKTWTLSTNSSSIELKTQSLQLVHGMYHEILLCWYQSTTHYVHNQYMAKAFMALDSLLKNRSNGAVFILMFKNSSHNSKVHDEKIQSFLNSFMPEISKFIPS